MHGATSIVDFLLSLKSDKRIKLNGSDQDYVRKLKVDIDASDNIGRTPLIYGIFTGNKAIVEALLAAGAQIDKADRYGFNVLHYAANPDPGFMNAFRNDDTHKKFKKYSNKEFIQFIIEEASKKAQLDIDSPAPRSNQTPLLFALNCKNRAAVEAFLEAEAQVNKTNSSGQNAFHLAAENNDKDSIELLIKASKAILLDIEANDDQGYTPLMRAAAEGNTKAVKALLEAGASVQGVSLNNHNCTPLHALLDFLFDYIPDEYLNIKTHVEFEKLNARFKRYKKITRLLLEAGVSMHTLNADQETPLSIAFDVACNSPSVGNASIILTELLAWRLYQIWTASALPEDITIFQSIKNEYLHSEESQSLRQANPLLEWIFTQLIDCTSKKQLIEKILEYIKAADQEKQRIRVDSMLETIDYLLLKEDILEELRTHLPLDLLKNLKKVFRYHYSKELKEKIFNSFDEGTLNELMNSTTIENDHQYANVVDTIYNHLINYCNHTQIKSPFINKIIRISQDNENKKIVDLLTNGYVASKELTDLEVANVLKENVNATLQLLKNIKTHLDYIIQQDGRSLNSPTPFGAEAGEEIIFD